MICSACGTSVDEASRYCPYCGAFVGQTCPACKATSRANASFCQHCGTAIRIKTTTGGGATKPWRVPGERKRVTMIFADMVASMEFIADIDEEEARRLIESVTERMIFIVGEFGGVVH